MSDRLERYDLDISNGRIAPNGGWCNSEDVDELEAKVDELNQRCAELSEKWQIANNVTIIGGPIFDRYGNLIFNGTSDTQIGLYYINVKELRNTFLKKGKVVPIHLADVPGVSEPSGIVLDESQNRLYSTGYHVQGLTDTMKRIKLIPFISGIGQHGIGNFNFDESGTLYLTSSDSRELIQIIKTSNL